MGEIADMMIEGFLDAETGEFLDGKSPGYPRVYRKGKIVPQHKPYKRTPAEKKIASIRKEIAIMVKEKGISIEEARKQMNIKYGKGWRERGLIANDPNQWSEEDLKGL